MITRRIPGGQGSRKDADHRVNRKESEFTRNSMQDTEDGWVISTVGEVFSGHQDTTGAVVQTTPRLYYVPSRTATVEVAEARVTIVTASASQEVHTALYIYDHGAKLFRQIPGTYVAFSAAATGLQQKTLSRTVSINPKMRLFIGIRATDNTVAVEGFQSGASAAPRVIRRRSDTLVGQPLQPTYTTIRMDPSTGVSDTPMVAYLSQIAASVL